jgi:predicted nucleotidyltransferase
METRNSPVKEVGETLDALLEQTKSILGPKLVALYLYGSLATGDFDPESSDIDFLTATSKELSNKEIDQLKEMHEGLRKSGLWGQRLEGAYIPVRKLWRYDPSYEQPFLSSDSPFRVTKLGWDWIINRHILLINPLILYGPQPSAFIRPISEDELVDAVRQLLKLEWTGLIDSDVMKSRHYQGFAVLTMCRAIFALKNRQIVSKKKAADWAIENLDPKWKEVIKNSLTWRKQHWDDEKTLVKTKEFVKEILATFGR